MVEIRFKPGAQFNKIQLVKYVFKTLNISFLKDAKALVESGVIRCPDHEYHNTIKMIEECGGIVIANDETNTSCARRLYAHILGPTGFDGSRSLSNAIADAQVTMLNKSEKKNVPTIRIVPSGYEEGLAIQSEIPVEKYVFQTLNDYSSLWQFVTNQMPFICGFTQQRIQLQNGEEEYRSLLGARISTNRNTIDEITSLSKVVRDVHTEIISTILKFHNLAEKSKPFIDDAPVETRSDSND